MLSDAVAGFAAAVAGGIAIGAAAGVIAVAVLRWLDNPSVEVLLSLVLPFAAYLPADRLGLSGVLAAVTAGLIVGSRLGTILGPQTRVLWLSTWKMVGFVLNGFAFVLIGLELPHILTGLGGPAGVPAVCTAGVAGETSCSTVTATLTPGSVPVRVSG